MQLRNLLSRLTRVNSDRPPIPPKRLLNRIGKPSRENYLQNGERVYGKLDEHVGKYRKLSEFDRVLDWGCGCGRVARMMLTAVQADRFHGCDIDPDAIKWMQQTYPDSGFTNIDPYPPTPYPDGYFDFIYGISVFTHLDEATQFKWLTELARISREDAIVAVSVHRGNDAMDSALRDPLQEKGFADIKGPKEPLFSHFLEQGYYRLTKHSKDYVMQEWSRYFEILEFVEHGIYRQDLVIMRPRHETPGN